MKRSTEQLITALNKRRCDWHRKIDDVISKLETDIENTEINTLTVLKKEDEINNTLTEITEKVSIRKYWTRMMPVFILSTNSETHNLEDSLPNS